MAISNKASIDKLQYYGMKINLIMTKCEYWKRKGNKFISGHGLESSWPTEQHRHWKVKYIRKLIKQKQKTDDPSKGVLWNTNTVPDLLVDPLWWSYE